MKKISEYEGDEALDLLADLIEPVGTILADRELAKAVKAGDNKLKTVGIAIKNHKKEVIQCLARLEGVDLKEYKPTIMTITSDLMSVLNDKDLIDFFTSQA